MLALLDLMGSESIWWYLVVSAPTYRLAGTQGDTSIGSLSQK